MIKINLEFYQRKNNQISNLYKKNNKAVLVQHKSNQFFKLLKNGELKHYQNHNCLHILAKSSYPLSISMSLSK